MCLPQSQKQSERKLAERGESTHYILSRVLSAMLICDNIRSKKEDWNEVVRKSTVHRDPIGSTRASIVRRDRRSLKRHILEQANQGLLMDTDVLVRKFYFICCVSELDMVKIKRIRLFVYRV